VRRSRWRPARKWSPRKRKRSKSSTKPSEPRTVTVALALGANLGDAAATLRDAVLRLLPLLAAPSVASLYRTRPEGPPQAPYLNTALVGRSALGAEELLAVAKRLELAAGRRPAPRLQPRPLDVDLLLWDGRVAGGPELVLPHPRLVRRRFVLVPLAEIAPELRLPPAGRTAAALAAALPDDGGVERVGWPPPARSPA
jgi:2-amino-4-hydroxy-6-hydroxymethyldihydropteridine diphosphokinase